MKNEGSKVYIIHYPLLLDRFQKYYFDVGDYFARSTKIISLLDHAGKSAELRSTPQHISLNSLSPNHFQNTLYNLVMICINLCGY